jgi:hypothetical protein
MFSFQGNLKAAKSITAFFILLSSIGFAHRAVGDNALRVPLFITERSPGLEFMLTQEVSVMKKILAQWEHVLS